MLVTQSTIIVFFLDEKLSSESLCATLLEYRETEIILHLLALN